MNRAASINTQLAFDGFSLFEWTLYVTVNNFSVMSGHLLNGISTINALGMG